MGAGLVKADPGGRQQPHVAHSEIFSSRLIFRGNQKMPRGGYRAGAGRPKKGARSTREAESPPAPSQTPLSYMLAVMNDVTADPVRRDRMALAAAPFVHKRVVDTTEGKKEVAKNTATRAGKAG